jgi:CelD/BcsL family acetyltransferase involved in cellulose biosynthesis
VEDPAALVHATDEWDELVVACGQPMCAPDWSLAWWRHVAPRGALLRTVLVRDAEGALVGVAPYFASVSRMGRTDYRLLGSGLAHPLAPVAVPGRAADVAASVAKILERARPRPHVLTVEGASACSQWPALLAQALPGRFPPWRYRSSCLPAPVVTRRGRSAEEWFAGRSANFRQQMRRLRRRLEGQGGRLRLARAGDIEADVAALARLHRARWTARGSPGVIDVQVERMLSDAGRALAGKGRFRLWVLEAEGTPISAQLFTAAGGEMVYWNGGFEERWSDVKPAMLTILGAIEHAFSDGIDRVHLGAGAQPYKRRFADADDALTWDALVLRDARYPVTRAQLLPAQMSDAARRVTRSLPSQTRDRASRVLRGGVRRSA